MTDHDPLCPWRVFHHPGGPSTLDCQCELIAQVSERIAQAIEADDAKKHPLLMFRTGIDAARIARNGGRDE